ncbi:PBP1A family penicillin-binding protein [Hoeflea sp.]|uniref:PBP1A family penicillin-binding protein n=1 Tax=Hoeflea sp. TaxID=1940281 RepID=UPI0025B9199A|nr:PBP1A family penicillin-binding protein [Hoeflea sp.]MBU4529382.1 PBP1A family penicillin-binding protein [Alphaproteobacteria bacterium]MBU4544793.1 PBP1A family penicillin-binding protein [Alphaproteobacteria bacterium]MBU4548815.1 PBP1A family penicillin-binding protein [Alphaproteobacteria bacterium]MBV1785038.1 PBP1A family penicillin-binding protein [Hoeflea sp.]
MVAITVAAAFAIGIVLTAGVVIWAVRDMPLADILPPLEEPRLELVTAAGETLYTQGAYRAGYVPLVDMPPTLVSAVIAVEDRRFYSHGGIDLRAIARAAIANLRGGGISQGGSTITQQLVKVLYLSPERTFQRKLQEMVLAIALERQFGKDRILELYLNSVYLGSGAWGAPAAAEIYFGHTIAELSHAEAAVLAAGIRAPSQINLLADPETTRSRAALVLQLMRDQDLIAQDETMAAAVSDVALLEARPPPSRAGSYYVDWVLKRSAELSDLVDGQFTVTATIDPVLQNEAERIVAEIMAGPGLAAGASQAALVAMTPDGQVRAMVGGVDYETSQFNRATDAMRQPGSVFKLPVYLAAIAIGMTPGTVVSDAPIEIEGWSPENYGGGNSGRVTLTEAFARSLNAATVRLAQDIGTENIIAVARQLGIEGELTEGLSLALGTSEVTLLDMTEAYAAVLAGRMPVKATGVASMSVGDAGTMLAVTADGPDAVDLRQAQPPMLELLRAVVTSGTGQGADLPGYIGGKTGTSQDNRDAWFIGFSETLVIGVWVGNDDASPMDGVTGGGIPVDIWRSVMAASQQTGPDASHAPAESLPVAASEGAMQCNLRACSRSYRSFRASDCTYQPYRGRRQICTR